MKKFIFCVVIFCFFLQISVGHMIQAGTKKNNDFTNKKEYKPTVFKDEDTILKILEQPQNIKREAILELIKSYYEAKIKKAEFDHLGGSKQYPLIVIEGLAGSGKTTAVLGLSEKINASKMHRISRQLKEVEKNYDKLAMLHDATGQLLRHIETLEMYPLLNNTPIVLDRYWDSTAVSIITHKAYYFDENVMPKKGDKVYNWPENVLKPDVIIFLQVNEEERQKRLRDRNVRLGLKEGQTEMLLRTNLEYRKCVLLAYQNMNNTPSAYYVVDANQSREKVLEEIYNKVQPLLIY